MNENYRTVSDAEFIKDYGVELSYGDNGKPTGKIRSMKPVSEEGFIEEMLIRKPRLLSILLEAAGWKEVHLNVIAYGKIDEAGNRADEYVIETVTLDDEKAKQTVKRDFASVPWEERKDVAVFLDSYPLLLKADDDRTADELFNDLHGTPAWPYSMDVDSLTLVTDTDTEKW